MIHIQKFGKLLLLAVIMTLTQSVSAEEEKIAGKLVYSELGGPGVLMSVNFDSRFKCNERLGLGFRAGVGFDIGEFGMKQNIQTYYTIPVGLNYVLGKSNSNHTFEVGAGVTFLTREVVLFVSDKYRAGYAIGHLNFMYRFMPVNGGFSFRIGLAPVIGTAGEFFPMVAVSIGYVF